MIDDFHYYSFKIIGFCHFCYTPTVYYHAHIMPGLDWTVPSVQIYMKSRKNFKKIAPII